MKHKIFNHINRLKNGMCDDRADIVSERENVEEQNALNTEILKKFVAGEIYYFKDTESTNIEAKRAENVPDRSVFIAEKQYGGRGRRGRTWSAPSGCGLWMSIYLKPQIAAEDVSQLTLAAGLAVARAIPGARIKWPNDVILDGKKVCGILTELSAWGEKINYAVVGIGVNVNTAEFDTELADKATSLYLETGKKYNREEVFGKIMHEFECIYDKFLTYGFEALREDYKKLCATLEREIVIIKDGVEYSAYACDISSGGELVVQSGGKTEIVNSGEVSVRGLLGYN